MNKIIVALQNFWHNLPKEVKVAVYIITSAAVAELIKYLSNLNFNDAILMGVVNVIIVAFVELKRRIDLKNAENR